MPKIMDTEAELARLTKASPHETFQYTIRMPAAVALVVARTAAANGLQLAQQIRELLTEYTRHVEHGVSLTFPPDQRDQLDRIAGAIGIDRESVVKTIVGESLPRYLQRAIDLQAERDALAAKLPKPPKRKHS